MGCDFSRTKDKEKKVEKKFSVYDNSNNEYIIEKYYNDITFTSNSIRFDYNLISGNVDKLPNVIFVELKSSTPITDNTQNFKEIYDIIEKEMRGGRGNINNYYEATGVALNKGKYYQAFIFFRTQEMIDKSKTASTDQMNLMNIKGRIFLSSAKQYNGVDGFSNYKKQGPMLKGFEYPVALIPKEYHKID